MLVSTSISIIALVHALGVAAGAGPGQLALHQAGDDPCTPVCPPEDPSNPDLVKHIPVACDAACNGFDKCDGGKLVRYECPAGLVFNPENLVCDFPENYECPSIPDCCNV